MKSCWSPASNDIRQVESFDCQTSSWQRWPDTHASFVSGACDLWWHWTFSKAVFRAAIHKSLWHLVHDQERCSQFLVRPCRLPPLFDRSLPRIGHRLDQHNVGKCTLTPDLSLCRKVTRPLHQDLSTSTRLCTPITPTAWNREATRKQQRCAWSISRLQ